MGRKTLFIDWLVLLSSRLCFFSPRKCHFFMEMRILCNKWGKYCQKISNWYQFSVSEIGWNSGDNLLIGLIFNDNIKKVFYSIYKVNKEAKKGSEVISKRIKGITKRLAVFWYILKHILLIFWKWYFVWDLFQLQIQNLDIHTKIGFEENWEPFKEES